MIQALNCRLNNISDTSFVHSNKALIVHESEETHDELAVHSVSDATVARNGFAEILDFEGPFETACEEAAEGSDERGEGCEDEDVELHGGDMNGGGDVEREGEGDIGEEGGDVVDVGNEDWVGSAFETSKDVCAEVLIYLASSEKDGCDWETYVHRADEVFVPHQHVGHSEAKDDCTDPGAYKSLHGLFRGKLNKLCFAESDTADVGEDVVRDDEGCWEKEPNHALKYIIHDEMGLDNDQV